MTEINDMAKRSYQTAMDHGFFSRENLLSEPSFPEAMAMVHSEVSEALTAHRERGFEEWFREDGKPEGVGSELADIVLRVFNYAQHWGFDIQAEMEQKHVFNITRPFMHGKPY